MKAKNNEIVLIYNSEKQKDKEVLGYAESLKDHKLNDKDISKSQLTERQIAEIANDLNREVIEIVDDASEKFKTEIKGKDFADEQLLKLLAENPDLLTTPVAYMNDEAFVVASQYSFVNKGLDVGGVKSNQANEFEK